MTNSARKMAVGYRLDTVGVAGSIPVEPTILKLKPTHDIIEIPENYELVPTLTYVKGKARMSRVLIKTNSKSVDKVLTFSPSKKSV